MTTQKFYAFGNGSFGCLYDHVDGPYMSAAEAAQVAADMFELSAHEARTLARDGIVRLQAVFEDGSGADYIEVFEVDEHWTCE